MSYDVIGRCSSIFVDLPSFGQRPGEAFPFRWWISKMVWFKGHLTCGCTRCILMYVQARWLPSGVRQRRSVPGPSGGCGMMFSSFLLGQTQHHLGFQGCSVSPSDTLYGLSASSLFSFCSWLIFPAPSCSFLPLPSPIPPTSPLLASSNLFLSL